MNYLQNFESIRREMETALAGLELKSLLRLRVENSPCYSPIDEMSYWIVFRYNGRYHSVAVERGDQQLMFSSEDFDEFLYLVVSEIVGITTWKWLQEMGTDSGPMREHWILKRIAVMQEIQLDWGWRQFSDLAKFFR